MEEFDSLWNYQESVDELRQKLLYKTIELDTLKMEANEQIRKQKEEAKQLIELLKMAYKERDDMNKILNKLMSSTELHPILPMKANSSITESNSLSETYNNHHSHVSSPIDYAVSSPDFSCMNMADSSHVNFLNKTYGQDEFNASLLVPKIDPAAAAIDRLVHGKVLPQKGKLLQAVQGAGPLLMNLLVAGRLPEWKNPPPSQPLKILPVSIKGCDTVKTSNQKPAINFSSSAVPNPIPLTSYWSDMFRGSAQMCSASVLSFSSAGSVSGLGNGWQFSSDAKRHKFH